LHTPVSPAPHIVPAAIDSGMHTWLMHASVVHGVPPVQSAAVVQPTVPELLELELLELLVLEPLELAVLELELAVLELELPVLELPVLELPVLELALPPPMPWPPMLRKQPLGAAASHALKSAATPPAPSTACQPCPCCPPMPPPVREAMTSPRPIPRSGRAPRPRSSVADFAAGGEEWRARGYPGSRNVARALAALGLLPSITIRMSSFHMAVTYG